MSGVDASNGFSNRFLWGFSSRTKFLPDGGNIHPEEFYEEICLLTKNIGVIHDAGSFQVHRNEEASRYWHEIYPELTSARVGRWGSSTSRGAPQVVRISLIFCLLDGKKMIELPHLQAAKAVWDYCCSSARWAFEDFQFSPNATKLIAALSHESMTIAETSQNPAWRAAAPSLGIDRVREILPDRWVCNGKPFADQFGWHQTKNLRETLAETAAWLKGQGKI